MLFPLRQSLLSCCFLVPQFDYDLGARLAWIKRVNHELLPQRDPPATWKARQDRPNLHENLKDGFDPGRNDPPSDQVLCLDVCMLSLLPARKA